MSAVKLVSTVGADGVLALNVPLGTEEAGNRVRITIERIQPGPEDVTDVTDPHSDDAEREEWHRFVKQTYGSCAGWAWNGTTKARSRSASRWSNGRWPGCSTPTRASAT